MSNPFEEKNKKPQKVVIDMSHAWTEEDKKKQERNEKGQTKSQEQKEYPRRFSQTRDFIKKITDKFKTNEDEVGYWEEVENDLDCGNEIAAMEKIEIMDVSKDDLTAWRKVVLEISKESKGSAYLLKPDDIGKELYEEFTQENNEMIEKINRSPEDFNEKSKRDYGKEVGRWNDAANELFTNGKSENAKILLEESITYQVEYVNNLRTAIDRASKDKDIDIKRVLELREEITTNSKKLSSYRRMRDSLYALEFSK